MFKKMKKRAITLVEMMIVMFLIAMITGVIAYNYTGSLEEGKAFKTRTAIEKIETILSLELARHPESASRPWKDIVKESSLAKDPESLMKDGWGGEFDVSTNPEIKVTSRNLDTYEQKKSHR